MLIGAAAAIACLGIVTPHWGALARWLVLGMSAALSAGIQIRRALPAGAPMYAWSWHADDDDDWFPEINPSTGIPMNSGSGLDMGGNAFMQSSDD